MPLRHDDAQTRRSGKPQAAVVRVREKPQMKRSDALAPLSRDHHHALVLARELSRADENDVAPVGARFVGFLARHELAHFDLEESVLLPAVPREERGRLLARRLLHDHEFFRAAMRELRDSSGTATSGFLHELGARLRAHVQMEERELFPYLEEALSERELEEIGAAIRSRDATEDVGTGPWLPPGCH
jgi:hemerythrin-like domain-containing protein